VLERLVQPTLTESRRARTAAVQPVRAACGPAPGHMVGRRGRRRGCAWPAWPAAGAGDAPTGRPGPPGPAGLPVGVAGDGPAGTPTARPGL